jgi:ubiquinone/menaquinone biosynthesis C-methylase UbiE
MALKEIQLEKLDRILSKVGDLNFKRRVLTMLDYLDIQDGDLILDMGCGEGFYAMIFEQLYECKVIAVDYDKKLLAMAKEWLKDSEKITFELGDICNLRFSDNYFDKIICTEVLEHIDFHEKATSELFRVLKSGGVLAVTVPNKNYPLMWDPLNKIRESLNLGHFNPLNGFWGGIWAYDHKRLYLPEDLKALLEQYSFNVKKLEVLTHYGVPFNHLVLYAGKSFYTKLPVPEEVRSKMEKFEWDETQHSKPVKKSIVGTMLSLMISTFFSVIKWVDRKNDKKFSLDVPTMAVAALAVKEGK